MVSNHNFRLAVVVASCGRPIEVGQLITHLRRQTHQPTKIVLSVVESGDLPSSIPADIDVIEGGKGSSAQRNRGLDAVIDDCDGVFVCDDDYLPSERTLEGIVRLFSAFPDLAGANGRLLADGINSPGIGYDDAVKMIETYDGETAPSPQIVGELEGLYGCNMALRTGAIGPVRFDEALPLYGWHEDVDFSARLLPHGKLVKTQAFAGVHRGVKGGRTSGIRFGYSQVVNPIYLARKRTMRPSRALKIITNNVLANHLRVVHPEPWVDRLGRLRGNWRAFGDLLSGRAHPTRILDLH